VKATLGRFHVLQSAPLLLPTQLVVQPVAAAEQAKRVLMRQQ
jgi:hypothetical protein